MTEPHSERASQRRLIVLVGAVALAAWVLPRGSNAAASAGRTERVMCSEYRVVQAGPMSCYARRSPRPEFNGNMMHCKYTCRAPHGQLVERVRGKTCPRWKKFSKGEYSVVLGETYYQSFENSSAIYAELRETQVTRKRGANNEWFDEARCFYRFSNQTRVRVSLPMRYSSSTKRYECSQAGIGENYDLDCERLPPKRPTGGGQACPFVYVEEVGDNGVEFVWRTEVIRNLVGAQSEATQRETLGPLTVREGVITLRITEEKDELSFLDHIALEVEGQTLLPDNATLAAIDGESWGLQRGDKLELQFSGPTLRGRESIDNAVLVSHGYYEPLTSGRPEPVPLDAH